MRLRTLLVPVLLFLAACGDTSDPLEQKLAAQFDAYERAEARAIERIVDDGGTVARAEWESWLQPDSGEALSSQDRARLVEEHDRVVRENREAAIRRSEIDLDRVRRDPAQVARYCSELPKGGLLHIHASGTRDEQTIDALLNELDPMVDGRLLLTLANNGTTTLLYPDEVTYLSELPVALYSEFGDDDRDRIRDFFFLPDDPPAHPFERFEAIFSISSVLLNGDEAQRLWVDEKTHLDFLRRAADLGVSYVEFTKVMSVDDAQQDQLERWAAEWREETGIIVRWNVAFVRLFAPEDNAAATRRLIDQMEQRPSDVIVGIDLLANETNAPALETAQQIYVPVRAAHDTGRIRMSRTMHSGELGAPENPRDAILLGANRLGHGVLLAQDPITLEFARRRRDLGIEINLKSNLLLGSVGSMKDHPFLRFLRLGFPASLSTDDEGMFKTDIARDCALALEHSDVTHDEMKAMSFHSIAKAFATDDVREGLFADLGGRFDDFEARWTGRDAAAGAAAR